jgi:hypothetical protein
MCVGLRRKVPEFDGGGAGTKQLSVEVASWERATALVARFLEAQS